MMNDVKKINLGKSGVNLNSWNSKNNVIRVTERAKPNVMCELLYRKGIPFCRRLFLNRRKIIKNCRNPIIIIEPILIYGLVEKQIVHIKLTKDAESARDIKLIDSDSKVVKKANLSFILPHKSIYIDEINRIIIKFIVELLVDNKVNISERKREKIVSHSLISLLGKYVLVIF